jgi:outer membrane lipopolysaccharide assembly protein LptE/RlpB
MSKFGHPERVPFARGTPTFTAPCALKKEVAHPQRGSFARGTPILTALLALTIPLLTSCGYHAATSGRGKLPQGIHVVAVPEFVNQSRTYRIEQVLTQAVVREFATRTSLHVAPEQNDDTDATLRGTVVTAQAAPLTYDAQTGRASSALITVTMKVTLTDRKGRVLFDNPNYLFREQYQVSRDISTFFEEESPAIDRLSRDFARSLVSDVLEGF